MSRGAVLSLTSDNAGFAKWVHEREAYFSQLKRVGEDFIIFGEWCGPGIQKGVAINKIPTRSFAVFGMRYFKPGADEVGRDGFISEPSEIAAQLKSPPNGIHVIPWYAEGKLYKADWAQEAEAHQSTLDVINADVLAIEACDPWVKSEFGVEGIGEGLVFYPVDTVHAGYRMFSNLCFKAKGEKHQVVAHTKPAQVDPSIAASALAYAEMVVTEARLEQGSRAVSQDGNLDFDTKNMGAFMKWVMGDLAKECGAELEASGLDPKIANKQCEVRARTWYLDKVKSI
jgi:hypothetical protein